MVKIAINGFGRIGRVVARQLYAKPEFRKNIQLVCVNDTSNLADLTFSLKYDTTHGKFPGTVSQDGENVIIDGEKIRAVKQLDPLQLPWKELGVDIVFECTGRFTDKEGASKHLQAGAKKVFVSAPGKGMDLTVVMGVNHEKYEKSHQILSLASCTTNCLVPVAHVVHNKFGIVSGLMTTVHSYTGDQRLLDNAHRDPRRSRSAAVNMIPTTTGAAKSVGEVIPALKGKLDGLSIRVPTPNVSITDAVFLLSKKTSKDEINAALLEASKTELAGIMGIVNEPLVSSDFNGNELSSIVDVALTNVITNDAGASMAKICAWYDNETGFSTRMLEFAAYVARR
jgi:glyceraldehyde 3-phosphate dehydrogenase